MENPQNKKHHKQAQAAHAGSQKRKPERQKKADKRKRINFVTSTIIRTALRFTIYAVLIMLIITGVRRAYSYGYAVFNGAALKPGSAQEVNITVEEGQSIIEVAKELKEKGLVEYWSVVVLQKFLYDYTVYPGTYLLSPSMTSKEMLNKMGVEPVETYYGADDETEAEELE